MFFFEDGALLTTIDGHDLQQREVKKQERSEYQLSAAYTCPSVSHSSLIHAFPA